MSLLSTYNRLPAVLFPPKSVQLPLSFATPVHADEAHLSSTYSGDVLPAVPLPPELLRVSAAAFVTSRLICDLLTLKLPGRKPAALC